MWNLILRCPPYFHRYLIYVTKFYSGCIGLCAQVHKKIVYIAFLFFSIFYMYCMSIYFHFQSFVAQGQIALYVLLTSPVN